MCVSVFVVSVCVCVCVCVCLYVGCVCGCVRICPPILVDIVSPSCFHCRSLDDHIKLMINSDLRTDDGRKDDMLGE